MILKAPYSSKIECVGEGVGGGCRVSSGGAKVLCILRHPDIQLILAYSWARPAILVQGSNLTFFLTC